MTIMGAAAICTSAPGSAIILTESRSPGEQSIPTPNSGFIHTALAGPLAGIGVAAIV